MLHLPTLLSHRLFVSALASALTLTLGAATAAHADDEYQNETVRSYQDRGRANIRPVRQREVRREVRRQIRRDDQEAGTVADSNGRTEYSRSGPEQTSLANEVWGGRPLIGVVTLDDIAGNSNARFVGGFTIDMDALKFFKPSADTELDRRISAGAQFGVLASHFGQSDSNFIGTSSSSPRDFSSNLYILPFDLKAGYMVTPEIRLGGHLGTNLIYRSSAAMANFGGDSALKTDHDITLYPNAGLDFDWAFAPRVSLTIRPDLTFTPGGDVFTGAAGVAFSFGSSA